MTFTADDIKKLAALSRVELSSEEEALFASQIGSVLAYIEQIQEVTGATIENADEAYSFREARDRAFPNRNKLREDADNRDLGQEPVELVRAAPTSEENASGAYVKVKKILG